MFFLAFPCFSQAAEQLLAQKGGQLDEATIAAELAKQREKRRAAEKVLAELEVRIAAIGQTLVLVRYDVPPAPFAQSVLSARTS